MRSLFLLALVGIMIFSSCTKVPVTGRRQVNLLPESALISTSLTSYQEFLKDNKPIRSGRDYDMVKRVGGKIAAAANDYLRQHKQLKRVKNFKWEFNLVGEDAANAWAMPGGKVVVYKGILPITKDETGLAVVLGHEVAHAIARHGNERVSQQMGLTLGGIGLSVAASNKPQETQDIINAAYGLGTSAGVLLPFSRKHESEADKMGLIFMAMAGYNPREAAAFWTRMNQKGGANVPELLSTHPSHGTRIKDINDFLPTALQYYKGK